MSRITPVAQESFTQEHRDLIDKMTAIYGSEPTSFGSLARVPGLLDAAAHLGFVVMLEGKIDVGLKWLVANVASRAAGCMYCSAHSGYHAAHAAGVDPAKVAAVWEFESDEIFSEPERAALRLAVAAGQSPNCTTEETFIELRKHFDDDQIAELVAVIALFGFFNRWNDTVAPDLEDAPMRFGQQYLAASGWSEPAISVKN